jgi:hypothetical protein
MLQVGGSEGGVLTRYCADPSSPTGGGAGQWTHNTPHAQTSPAASSPVSDGKNDDDNEDDRASIISLDSDSTNGPFFWYRVVSKFAPKGRNCHTASMVGDKMMVFGGFGGSKWFDELWVFDTRFIEWYSPEVRSAAQGSPAARYAHSAVAFRGLLYIFGGYGGDDAWLNDLWVLDTQAIRVRDQRKAAMTWFRPQTTGSPPPPRAAHTANIVGQKLYIFGGNNGSIRLNDLYSLDTQTMTWKKETCGGSRSSMHPRPHARSVRRAQQPPPGSFRPTSGCPVY